MQGKRTNPYYVAQDILSRRNHSEYELRQKLARKKFTAQQIDEVVAWLKAQRLLNDHTFARTYAESILRTKAVGPRWLQNKLHQKGVPSPITRGVLNELVTAQDEELLLVRAIAAWRATHRAHAHDTQRLRRFLLSRGFSFTAIDRYLQQDRGD